MKQPNCYSGQQHTTHPLGIVQQLHLQLVMSLHQDPARLTNHCWPLQVCWLPCELPGALLQQQAACGGLQGCLAGLAHPQDASAVAHGVCCQMLSHCYSVSAHSHQCISRQIQGRLPNVAVEVRPDQLRWQSSAKDVCKAAAGLAACWCSTDCTWLATLCDQHLILD